VNGVNQGSAHLFRLDTDNLSFDPVYEKKITHGVSGISLVNGDRFGRTVSLNAVGDMLAIGAVQDNTGFTGAGAVYLLGLDPGNLSADPVYGTKIAHGTSGLVLNAD